MSFISPEYVTLSSPPCPQTKRDKDLQRMYKVKITAIRKIHHADLSARYENPIEHACDIEEGQCFISVNGMQPEGLCDSAWESMQNFVTKLAQGSGNFFEGWMKNPYSAMISCNDGFRPVSFYLERISDEKTADNLPI